MRKIHQHLPKVKREINNDDNPSRMNKKSSGAPLTMISSGKNIATSGNKQAIIKVKPVDSNLLIIFGKMLFLLSALIAPSFPSFALLKIDIEASTKPKSIPAIVESTPAVVRTSGCFIGLKTLADPYVNNKRKGSLH